MRVWVNSIIRQYLKLRYQRIRKFMEQPEKAQENLWKDLIYSARHTAFGREYGFQAMRSPADFKAQVPVSDYDSLKPYIERMMAGERDILWPGAVRWFSKSSGTTSDKSKFIPVSDANLSACHIKGSWDTMTLFYHERPDARQFECKSLIMGGSLAPFEGNPRVMRGDVSAIMTYNMPWVGRPFFTPDFETALLANFEEKLERTAHIVSKEPNLVSVGGVPTWMVVLFRRVLEITGKKHLLEVWPNLQACIHGGVSFEPYREQFQQFFPSEQVSYQEIYNASEGYFAVQDRLSEQGMLLLLQNGVYYEFVPMSDWNDPNPRTLSLEEVELDQDYALIISTNSGLWRYKIGDTVRFTSLRPYRIKVTGRTQAFINAFGEELMVDNADKALARTCKEFNTEVVDYTVAPVFFQGAEKGCHQWLVEFTLPPADVEAFAMRLDQNLQDINSDYEAKRFKDLALTRLQLRSLPEHAFLKWLKSKGKLGGQNKVPRLANNRKHVDELLLFLSETTS